MTFFLILLVLLAILISFVIISTIIKVVLFCIIRYDYDYKYLIVPSIITVIVWSAIVYAWNTAINRILNINILNVYFNSVLNWEQKELDVKGIIIITIICVVIGIVLQAISYYTVNINYRKISGNIRFFLKKIFRIKFKDENAIAIDTRPDTLYFGEAILSSLFAFSLIFFFILFFLSTGKILSTKIIS